MVRKDIGTIEGNPKPDACEQNDCKCSVSAIETVGQLHHDELIAVFEEDRDCRAISMLHFLIDYRDARKTVSNEGARDW